jgi:hypothetical protein
MIMLTLVSLSKSRSLNVCAKSQQPSWGDEPIVNVCSCRGYHRGFSFDYLKKLSPSLSLCLEQI